MVHQLKQAQLVSDYGSVAAQTIAPTTVYAESPNLIVILSLAIVIGVAVAAPPRSLSIRSKHAFGAWPRFGLWWICRLSG